MKSILLITIGCVAAISSSAPALSGKMDCSMMSQSDAHSKGVDMRGDKVMGFSHAASTHHFLLYADGGAIQIAPDSSSDTKTRDMIRGHLKMIAQMFSDGNFKMPMFIHATTVPGTDTMKRLKKEIIYTYEDTPTGGAVRIKSDSLKAVAAIHNFMWFQIKDHRTGDPVAISK